MSFTAQIAKFAKGTRNRLQVIRKGVTFKLFNAIVADTPVLTGLARANWRLSVGEPAKESVEKLDPSGAATMAAIQNGVNATDGEKPVYLSNNLPYIAKLEMGWSKKAPEGMVRRNIVRFNRLIKVETAKST